MREMKRVRLKELIRARLVLATEEESFEDLADRAGVSRNWLSMVYNGHRRTVRITYADKLAKALGTSVEIIAEPIEDMREFGNLLKRFRRMRKISQISLAEEMGISVSKLSRIENASIKSCLSVEQIELAVDALDLTKTDANALMDAWAPLDLE